MTNNNDHHVSRNKTSYEKENLAPKLKMQK